MKAAILEKFSEPFKIADIDIKPSTDEMILDVKACGICGRDLVIWKGGFPNLNLPLILGHEIYGELDGKPMGIYPAITCGNCEYCKAGKENLCSKLGFFGEKRYGGYAEKIAVSSSNLFELPDKEYEKYAACVCPLATTIHATKLVDVDNKIVLVTGAGGGVGIHAIQYLRTKASKVIAITSKSKEEIVGKFSDEVITEREFSKYAKNVDVIFEMVGSETINESLRALKREGTLILIGNVTGKEISISRPALSIMREHRIIGSAAYTKREIIEAVKIISIKEIKPVYQKFKLEEINEAYKKLMDGKIIGRAILSF